MKRTPLLRRTPLKRGTKIRVAGVNDTAEIKREIQAVAREIVIERDGGCILRNKRLCGGDIGYAVLQADHLITRANSATYADTRLIVCVCNRCHAWKSCGGNREKKAYDELVRTLISKERVELWDRCERDSWRPTKMDWPMALVALKAELTTLQ